jgi:hypothetical protein
LFRGRTRVSTSTADPHGADPRERGGALVHHRACFRVSRSTPTVRAARRRIKRGMAVNRRPLQSTRLGALRVSHASRLATTSWAPGLRRELPRRRRLLRSVELRAVGADPPRRASQARARLREPPKPSRPLSATVAPGAPMSALPFPRHQLAPRAVRLVSHSPSKPGPRPRLWFREARPRPGHPSIVSAVTRSRP